MKTKGGEGGGCGDAQGEVWWALCPGSRGVSLLACLGISSQHSGAREADGQAALGPRTARPGGGAFRGQSGALQLAADPPQMERTALSETPSAWAPWHPVAQTVCFRCRGLGLGLGNPRWGRSHKPRGKAKKSLKKKKKKERKRNACCLHNPSPSMHQPAPSPRNTVGAVGADQEWSFPRGLHPVKLPLTVPQKSGAVEQRGCGCKS